MIIEGCSRNVATNAGEHKTRSSSIHDRSSLATAKLLFVRVARSAITRPSRPFR
jgi:hypothetical protein